MRKTLLLSAAIAALISGPAMAEGGAKTGFYGQIDTGVSFNQETDLDTQLKNIAPGNYSLSFDDSALVSGAVGYDFGQFRADLELGYTKADMDKVTIASVTGSPDGDLSALTVMANGYWDIPTSTNWTPFVGGGLGFAHLSAESAASGDPVVDDSDTVLAYQASAGASYALTDHVSLVGAYRYLGTADASFKTTSATLGASDDVKANFSAHQIRIGARYTF